eukprot:CAMPEP_0118968976 /NCGR_PEP_ID=MMETSP1173-20130426/6125_1 /TAXON_ID=1034831 /ORGANISM="Rhizochromulina marina cf, Strain CCMP1243" /LENGTH=121 /DNA_ID=CAMNT_0006918161 /DNA_START=39 /DNA_END=404 /DNA_ORIENTATION=-
MAMAVFDPKKTTLNEDAIGEFLRGVVTGDLTEVPGVGPANADKFADAGITNTHQLLGKFLMLKQDPPAGEDIHPIAFHMNCMAEWLQSIGISSHRGNIALAVAEKSDIMLPGIYDGSIYSG